MARLLIVEDVPALAQTLGRALKPYAREVVIASSLTEARASLAAQPPDAVLLDVNLPDGSGLSLMDSLRALTPWPRVIAISGSATPEETFRLAQAGVRAYVPKPIQLPQLEAAWRGAFEQPPDLLPWVKASVGHVPLKELEAQVRGAMVDEAIAQSRGNRRGAARMLEVSRQLLQQILRRRS